MNKSKTKHFCTVLENRFWTEYQKKNCFWGAFNEKKHSTYNTRQGVGCVNMWLWLGWDKIDC